MIGFLIPIVLPGYIVVGIIDIFSDLRDKLLYNKHNGQGGVKKKEKWYRLEISLWPYWLENVLYYLVYIFY